MTIPAIIPVFDEVLLLSPSLVPPPLLLLLPFPLPLWSLLFPPLPLLGLLVEFVDEV